MCQDDVHAWLTWSPFCAHAPAVAIHGGAPAEAVTAAAAALEAAAGAGASGAGVGGGRAAGSPLAAAC